MLTPTISEPETRDGERPIPYIDTPVGTLDHDGHAIDVWSIATTVEGKVLFLNCTAADAAVSATIKRLLRKNGGKATFHPATGTTWTGPNELSRLVCHYDTVTTALTRKGLRLKNQCIIPDWLDISVGLSRPMEALLEARAASDETEDADEPDADEPEIKPDASLFRYILGDAATEKPPTGALFAHLRSLVVVCHPSWEPHLWAQGKAQGLILPQPALGIRAWSIPREWQRWADLVGALWKEGALPRPEPSALLAPARSRKGSPRRRPLPGE